MYLGEPLFDRHELAVWAGGHVDAGQHTGKRVRRRLELSVQDVGESAFVGFDDGAGVMGDQSAQQGIGAPGVAQVPGAIELVQAREGKGGGVADVMQPGGGFQQVGVRAEDGRQGACPCGDALGVRPAAGKRLLQEARASCSPRDASVFMRPRLDSRDGTFSDEAGRLKTSCSASVPRRPARRGAHVGPGVLGMFRVSGLPGDLHPRR